MEGLFERLSLLRLVGKVFASVAELRPDVSRNTVYLALKDERPAEERSALRNYIREIGAGILAAKEAQLLAENEEQAAAQAA